MSDDDRDIDIESDDENDSDNGAASHRVTQNFTQAEKRAHHNALERKRRDHIKESFTSLREAVPSLKGEKASRAQILKKTTEYIQVMRRKLQSNRKDIEGIKKQNSILDSQIRILETAKNCDNIDAVDRQQTIHAGLTLLNDSSEGFEQDFSCRSKKMKTSYLV